MSYQALYRKFRPSEFDEVKGQEHIVTTLKNQIIANRIGHAYLLCGTRGTGKTTLAKLFAKSVNCENTVDGSPCNECEMCTSIQKQISLNVIEIDAASNNGVDNIREIRDEVQYSPTEGKYKVYIIDEVHMLSTGAFNALLKTLEEPPSYVIFILATTEPHKIPITILSRCQRYDLRRISIDTISSRLLDIMERENIVVEEKAIRYIAKVADGSMRDALSLLDQCISFYIGKELKYNNVLEILGVVDIETFGEMLDYIIQENVHECILKLEDIIMSGKELSQFVTDFTWYLRNVLLVKTTDNAHDILDVSSEQYETIKQQGESVKSEFLLRYIGIFSELIGQIKKSLQKRIAVEVALIKLCKPQMEINTEALAERIEKLEDKIEKGIQIQEVVGIPINNIESVQNPVKKKVPKPLPEEMKEIVNNWDVIINNTDSSMKQMLKNVYVEAGHDNELIIAFEDSLPYSFMNREDKIKIIEDIIVEKLHKQVQVRVKDISAKEIDKESFIQVLNNNIHMDIIIEE